MTKIAAFVALSCLAASPLHAGGRDALFQSSADLAQARPSIFAGASLRLGLDRRGNVAGRAALHFSGMSYAPDKARVTLGEGLQLSGGRTGRPALFVAGHDVGQLRNRANLSGTGTALVIGGVAVLVVAGLVIANGVDKASRCIGEEGDCD